MADFDFSSSVDEGPLRLLNNYFELFAKNGERVTNVMIAYNEANRETSVTFSKLNALGQKVTQTIAGMGETMSLVKESLSKPVVTGANWVFDPAEQKLAHLVDSVADSEGKIKRMLDRAGTDSSNARMERLNAEYATRDVTLKVQQDLYNKLAQQARERQGAELRENAELHARIQEQNRADAGQRIRERAEQHALELEDQRKADAKLLAEQEEARIKQQNLAGGAAISGQLRGQFVPRTTTNVSASEYQAFISGQARIRAAVESGAISQRDAWEVVQNTVRQTGVIYTGVAAQIQAATAQIASAEGRLGAAHAAELAKAEAASSKTGTRILITWQDVVRFIQFRVAYAIGFHLVGAFKQATQDIREFEIRISEIRTLAQEAGTTFEQWGDIIYKLSNRFGTPVEDIAKGVYETLSNQIAGGPGAASQASAFLATAEKFARVTVTSTSNAVDLLSSAINAYGFSVGEAERLSAIFFRTIDRGRVRAEDIANSFGQTLQTANALGVSFEEVNAALAVITNQGVKPAVAMTLLNNLFNKMLTPSKELADAFHKIGVNNGPEALAAFGGLVGVIQQLDTVTGGAAQELAGLFHEQRAFRGINSLTQAFGDLKQVVAEMQGDTLPKFNSAFEEVMGSSAKVVNLELNKIRNYFLKEFAEPFTDVLAGKMGRGGATDIFAGLVKQMGGLSGALDKVVTSVEYAATAFVAFKTLSAANLGAWESGITTALGKVQAGFQSVGNTFQTTKGGLFAKSSIGSFADQNGQLLLFEKSFSKMEVATVNLKAGVAGIGRAIGGVASTGLAALKGVYNFIGPQGVITLGILGIEYLYKRQMDLQAELDNAAELGRSRAEELIDRTIKFENDKFDERTRIVQRAVEAEFTVRNKGVADIRSLGNQAIAAEDALIKTHVENLKDSYTLLVKSIETDVRRVEGQTAGLVENIRKAEEARSRLAENLEERKLRSGLEGKTPQEEIKARAALAAKMQADGQALLQKAAATNIFARFAPIAPVDPKEVNRLIDDGNKKIARSIDLFDTIAEKRKGIEEKLKTAQQELDKLNKAGGNRDEILKQEAKLTALESERADTRHRRRREDQLALDDAVAAQRKKIAEAKEGNRDAGDEVRRKELQAQIADLNQQLTLTQQLGRSADSLNAIYKQQSDLLKLISDNQEADRKANEAKLVSEKERLQTMRTALGDIAAFKLPKDFEKSGDSVISALAKAGPKFGFTDVAAALEQAKVPLALEKLSKDIKKAFDTGLLDPNTTYALIKARAEFEKKASEEVAAHRLNQETELLAKQKKNLEDLEKETKDKVSAAQVWTKANVAATGGQLENILAFLAQNRATGVKGSVADLMAKSEDRLRYYQARLAELVGGQNNVKDLESQLGLAKRTPNNQEEINRLQTLLDSAKNTLKTDTIPAVTDKIRRELVKLQPVLQGEEGGAKYAAQIPGFLDTLTNLTNSFKGLNDALKQQQEYENALKTLSPELKKALEVQAANQAAANVALQTFGERLNTSIDALKNLQLEINATGQRLKDVIAAPAPQKPISAATFQSPAGQAVASAAGNNVKIDNLTLVNQSTGNAIVDSRQLFTQFTGLLRQGAVALPSEALG